MSSNQGKLSERTLRIASVVAIALVSILLLFMIETLAYFSIDRTGLKDQPFLVSFSTLTRGTTKKSEFEEIDQVDPLIAFAWNPTSKKYKAGQAIWPGVVVHGDLKEDGIRIFTLGGSTTDASDPANWPKQLHSMIATEMPKPKLMNGGTLGYSSSQEFLKLVRDVVPLAPDVVIAMNGVNDLGYIQSVKHSPMTHNYQWRTAEQIGLVKSKKIKWSVLLPNTVRYFSQEKAPMVGQHGIMPAATGFSTGVRYAATPVDNWHKNIRSSKAIADEFGIQYLVFLQPVLGANDKRSLGSGDKKLMEQARLKGADYIHDVKEFYAGASKICAQLTFCVDIHKLFPDNMDMYRDPRHPNERGYGMIAKKVLSELKARALLKQRTEINSKIPLYADSRSNFTRYFPAWSNRGEVEVVARARRAPNGLMQAARIRLKNKKSYLFQANEDGNIAVGDVREASVVLWAGKPMRINLRVARHCSKQSFEGTTETVTITTTPTRYAVKHKFKKPYACARFAIRYAGDDGHFYAWDPEFQ